MNKKQLGAFLKVMGKDEARRALMQAKVDRYDDKLALIATNGYMLAAVFLDEDAEEIEGRVIRREALEKWYKLATGKSRLTGQELVAVSADDYAQHGSYSDVEFVPWQKVVPSSTLEGQSIMHFNADYFKTVQDLDGQDSIRVRLHGALAPMEFETERGYYLVMPMKV